MTSHNVQIRLARRPHGEVQPDDFRIETSEVPTIGDGQALVRNRWLSLDPYMRGRMSEAKSYAANLAIGDVMIGGTVGEVVESKNSALRVGDLVVGNLGWQTFGVTDGRFVRVVRKPDVPASTYLGVVGMPGVTAWVGLLDIGQPKSRETVVVSAAAGAVGGVVGQLARMRGARAVGIAGGAAKCEHVVRDLGFDACVDYRSPTFADELALATPNGIDVDFENVGGAVMDAVVARMNAFGRIALCGLVSQYNAKEPYPLHNVRMLLTSRLKVEGFIVSERMERWPVALAELTEGVRTGRIRYRETIAEGLESAPRAFIGMLRGENLGKQLVRIG